MKARWIALGIVTVLAVPSVAWGAAKAMEVLVVNDDSRPVPSKVIGTPTVKVDGVVPTAAAAVERYTAQTEFGADGSEREVCGYEDRIAVPEGKRFVIESTVAEIRDGETAPGLFLYGHGGRPYLDVQKVSDADDTAGSQVSGSNDYWGATSDLRLLAGPTRSFSAGESGQAILQVIPCVITKGEDRWVRVQFTGYLENAS